MGAHIQNLDRKIPIKRLKSRKKDFDTRPSIGFDTGELPEVKDWKVGEEYEVILRIKQTGMHEIDFGPMKGKIRGEFTVVGVKAHTEPVTK